MAMQITIVIDMDDKVQELLTRKCKASVPTQLNHKVGELVRNYIRDYVIQGNAITGERTNHGLRVITGQVVEGLTNEEVAICPNRSQGIQCAECNRYEIPKGTSKKYPGDLPDDYGPMRSMRPIDD
jgi:hypothetical protein